MSEKDIVEPLESLVKEDFTVVGKTENAIEAISVAVEACGEFKCEECD
jgi:hypothetical protein